MNVDLERPQHGSLYVLSWLCWFRGSPRILLTDYRRLILFCLDPSKYSFFLGLITDVPSVRELVGNSATGTLIFGDRARKKLN